MRQAARIDMLFHSMLSRFFMIPARQPASGPVTFAQMRVLWAIDFKKGAAPGEIARSIGVSFPTVTELVDKLVRGRYVRREACPGDRRKLCLFLTSKGRLMLDEFARHRRERVERLGKVVGKQGLRKMALALESLNQVVGQWYGERT